MASGMVHNFAVAPQANVPRSSFSRSHTHKTTFDAGNLVPIYWDDVIPGDTFNMNLSAFCRLNTLLFPIMDNIYIDVHFFFVPIRQVWSNFRRFMGEEINPGDGIDFVMPVVEGIVQANHVVHGLGDYLGLPLVGSANAPGLSGEVRADIFRAYNHIYNEWYRDQNLINSRSVPVDDGPDSFVTNQYFTCAIRGKRHDYFTSCLPWPQKGDPVLLPVEGRAEIDRVAVTANLPADYGDIQQQDGIGGNPGILQVPVAQAINGSSPLVTLVGNVTNATATVNMLREAVAIQELIERDARGGTRYAEIVFSHFGVRFMDVTYRPEFLGGSTFNVNVHPVPNTAGTVGEVPQGELSAFATAFEKGSGFTKSFTEHGIVMGIASARADLTYQQGLNRHWSISTRYDWPWPALMHLGEQAVLNKEIWTTGSATPGFDAVDDEVFGYIPRYDEWRYHPSKVTGLFRSDVAGTLDPWHLAQDFDALPVLGQNFIEENPPIDRVITVPSQPHFKAEFHFNLQCARPMPLFAIPGFGARL